MRTGGNRKGKMKYDFSDPTNIAYIESYARDGLDNKQIAEKIGYNETYFSELVNSISELSEAIKRGRKPLDMFVETSLYKRATGTVKTKSITRRWMIDENGHQTTTEIVQEVETELPPDVGAIAFWLKNRKGDYWNKQPIRVDTTTNGKDITGSVDISKWLALNVEKEK